VQLFGSPAWNMYVEKKNKKHKKKSKKKKKKKNKNANKKKTNGASLATLKQFETVGTC
jgi:hypothetical protein